MFFPTSQQGTNAERSRHRNRQAVLAEIHRAGKMGRAEIARALSLSTQAVSNIIADLTSDGFLVERGQLAAGRGLPAKQYALKSTGGFALGIEVRPDAVFSALMNMEGAAVSTERERLNDTRPATVLAAVQDLQERALQSEPKAIGRMLGAGIVMPGPFGATGLSGHGSELAGWEDTDPTILFSKALGLPVEVSNDANAAAMAERLNGVAHGLDDFAYLYFGTGLGLGLVSKGRLVTGAFGNAGEIGHIPLPSGHGNLEGALSRLSVQRHLQRAGKPAGDIDTLSRLFSARDPDLHAWLPTASAALEYALAIIENLFDPQTVILGGAMPESILDNLVERTRLPLQSVSNRPASDIERLQRGTSGRMTATIGAAALVLNRTLSPHIAHVN